MLTEATFAITNMLAGVQGVDPMKLLEATDRAVDTQACSAPVSHVEVGFSAAELAAQLAAKGAREAHERQKAARAVMIAGVKAGRDTPARM